MDTKVFEELSALIYREAGIHLTPDKKPLLENRLSKRLRARNIPDAQAYLELIKAQHDTDELISLIDAISTNVTYFYREPVHFELLGKLLDEWQAKNQRKLRIWCAAASSGQEPYTIAITVANHIDLQKVDYKMLATDICTRVLREATEGIYSSAEVEKMPEATRKKFMKRCDHSGEVLWQMDPNLAKYMAFRRLNLSQFPFPLKGPIDFIFCRNVMIYFDRTLRQKIVNEFSRLLAPGGFLFLSHSESLIGIEHTLLPIGNSIFRRPEN